MKQSEGRNLWTHPAVATCRLLLPMAACWNLAMLLVTICWCWCWCWNLAMLLETRQAAAQVSSSQGQGPPITGGLDIYTDIYTDIYRYLDIYPTIMLLSRASWRCDCQQPASQWVRGQWRPLCRGCSCSCSLSTHNHWHLSAGCWAHAGQMVQCKYESTSIFSI